MLHCRTGRARPRAGVPAPGRPSRIVLAVLVALTPVVLAACDLSATMQISADGRAALHVETFIEKDLIEGDGPTCVQVMDGILEGWVTVEKSGVSTVDDTNGLRCTLDQDVDLVAQGWDGQSGSPLWQADSDQGTYVLDLPFSQGTGSGDLTTQDLTEAGLTGDVTLAVTMPGKITSTSAGTVDGDTVTVDGIDALVKDLVVHSGGTSTHTVWWMVAGIVALSLVLAWGARRLWRRHLSRRGRPGAGGSGRGGARTTSWPAHWPGGSPGRGAQK